MISQPDEIGKIEISFQDTNRLNKLRYEIMYKIF